MTVISRRLFVQSSVAALGAHRAWAKQSHVLPAQTPIGLQLYSVGADLQKDAPGTLHQVRKIGYERVETAGLAGLTAKAFRAQLDAAGLTCPSSHLQLGTGELPALFADAHTLGAHYVVTSGGFAPGRNGQAMEDYRALAEHLNDLGTKAKSAGLQYAYHNHNFEFRKLDGQSIGYDVLLQQTDPALVAFELDCGWMVAAGYNPVTYFEKYPGRYRMLHIKDFKSTPEPSTSLAQAERPQGTELGRGHIDYKPILMAAQKADIHDFYVEQEPPFLEMSAIAAVTEDYQYLRAL